MPELLDSIDTIGNPKNTETIGSIDVISNGRRNEVIKDIDIVGNPGGGGPRDAELIESVEVIGQLRKKPEPKHLRYPIELDVTPKNVIRFNVFQQRTASDDSGPGDTPFARDLPEQYKLGGRNFPVSGLGFGTAFATQSGLPGAAFSRVIYEDLAGISQYGINYFLHGPTMNYGKRTVDIQSSITLYMPDTVINQDVHDYQPISVQAASGRAGLYTAGGPGYIGTGSQISKVEFLFELAGRAGIFGSRATEAGLAGLGYALNPMLEMVYGGSQPRRFNFSFRFSPRNRKEAEEIIKIIKTFRYHSYSASAGAFDDDFSKNSGTRYLIPPNHFEIVFLRQRNNRFEENFALPRVTTCMLASVNTNYAAMLDTFTTFRDGTPVSISLDLEFIETVILTQNDIRKGY